MKKKRFLSLLLTIVMLVSTLAMSGCGAGRSSCICADGWQLSCLCNLDVQIVLVELVLKPLAE